MSHDGWYDSPRAASIYVIIDNGRVAYQSRDRDRALDDARQAALRNPERSYRLVEVADTGDVAEEVFRVGADRDDYPAIWEHRGQTRPRVSEPDATKPSSSNAGVLALIGVVVALALAAVVYATSRSDSPSKPDTPSTPSVSTPAMPSTPTTPSTPGASTVTETRETTPSQSPSSTSADTPSSTSAPSTSSTSTPSQTASSSTSSSSTAG
ncbi:hypothetical protein ACX31A_15395 [Dermacoccus nishinomiyaensis]